MMTRRRLDLRGFTLVELVAGMVISTLVMGALASAMVIAARGLGAPDSVLARTAAAAQLTDEIAAEVFCAETFSERGARAIAFTVADRNGDNDPERIRYEWSGTAGSALLRTYNEGTPVAVLPDVTAFDLSYQYRTVTEKGSPSTNESGEMLLIDHQPSLNLLALDLSGANWGGEFFMPSLPPDAVAWRVTKVAVRLKSLLSLGGATRIQLRLPGSGVEPGTASLAETLVADSLLSTLFSWREATIGAAGLSPTTGLCLVLSPDPGLGGSASIELQSAGAALAGGSFLSTTNGGASWAANDAKALAFKVYGTVTTLGDPPSVQRKYLTAVGVRLEVSSKNDRAAQTAVQIVNAPEVPLS